MPRERHLPPGYTIVYPNREKVSSHITRIIVMILLLVSVALILAVTIGGWSKLQGLKPVNFAYCLIYLVAVVFVLRWARGALPISAGLAILLLMVSLIAGTGAAGTSWFDRNHIGYGAAQSLFGGQGFSSDTLGLLTLLLAPVQILLIIFAMQGFIQAWNVEFEAPIDKAKRRRADGSSSAPPAAATA